MALSFPNSPTEGQIYTDTPSGNRWVWDSANTIWKSTSTFTQTITVSSTAPGTPVVGQLWWNQDYGRLLVYYSDGTSSQWVDASPSDYTSTLAYTVANAAFGKANTALQNTNVTFDGSLTITGNVGIGTGYSSSTKVSVRNSSNNTYSATAFLSGRTIDLVSNSLSANDYSGIRFADPAGGRESFFGVVATSASAGSFVFQSYDGTSAYAERMRIDASGRVTKPYHPSFKAGRSSGNVSATTTILFDTIYHNVGSCYNASTGRFTAPIAGNYFLCCNVFNTSGTSTQVYMKLNGNNNLYNLYYGSGYGNMHLSQIISLSINDYVEVVVTTGTVYAGGSPFDCTFCGYLLG